VYLFGSANTTFRGWAKEDRLIQELRCSNRVGRKTVAGDTEGKRVLRKFRSHQ
jgi:hypothetical protein